MIKKMGSFRSYVGLEEYEMKKHPSSPSPQDSLQPQFLKGELIISEALNVLKFTSLSKKKGLSGSLFVTNARVVFVSSDKLTSEDSTPLLSINTLLYYENPKGSAGGKKYRRAIKLGPSSVNNPDLIPSGSTRVHELLLACSNFRTTRYSFKFSPLDHGLRICNAIIHHAFPAQLERLFYFDYSKVTSADWRPIVSYPTLTIPSYLEKGDWLKELNITRSTVGYRISNVNDKFQLCGSLPEWIVVPADLNDARLNSLAEKLKGARPPHWSWGDSRGAAILRMSKLNNETESPAENSFFELLRKTHQKKRQPIIVDLDKELPSKEIRLSFNRLIELCCPETFSQYEETDNRFYSLLEHTKWLLWVSKSLQLAKTIAKAIVNNQDVIILQEQESRDLSCLCSSVIQVVVDARFRTVTGFFSLVQKEWIACGHPFHSSYMHASPVFLMFLDCVHQLMKQNPVDFEFNDRLLSHIWDACFDATSGTFLFDTPQQRKSMDRLNDFTIWSTIMNKDLVSCSRDEEQFPPNVPVRSKLSLVPHASTLSRTLVNPMYKLKSLLYPPTAENYPLSTVLQCSSCMCDVQLWENLYLKRMLEANPTTVVTITSRSEISKSTPTGTGDGLSCSSTPASTPNSKSPGSCETAFIYSLQCGDTFNRKSGRDPMVELRVVDSLLATLSSSTKYNRNYQGATSSSNSVFKDKQMNRSPGFNPNDSKYRRNPFSNH